MAHGAKSPVGMPRCSRRHFQLIFAGAAVKPLSDLRGEPGSGVWGGCATSVTGVGGARAARDCSQGAAACCKYETQRCFGPVPQLGDHFNQTVRERREENCHCHDFACELSRCPACG